MDKVDLEKIHAKNLAVIKTNIRDKRRKKILWAIWNVGFIAVFIVFIIWRGIYITHQAEITTCPNKTDSININYLAIPFTGNPAVSCSP